MSVAPDAQENTEEQKFLAVFPDIVTEVVSSPQFINVPEIRARVKELLEYNSSGGEKTRGLMAVHAYRMLEKQDRITEESMRLARVLGWCVELTSLVLLDDMTDNASTRRGRPCWYRLPGVGLLTVNDSLLLLTIVFDLLKEYFGDRDCFPDILYTFKEALCQLCIGQYPTLSHSKDYKQFTMENFKKYADYKRTYYTFKLPMYVSLLLTGKSCKNALHNVEHMLIEMGVLLTMQNDYLDCYVDEAIAGKAGNDIQEGKCTWLAVLALQQCSPAQRDLFVANYGSADKQRVQRIKRLYEDLNLPAFCRKAMQSAYDSIVRLVQALPPDNLIPPTLLLELFEMVYQMKVD